MTLNNKKHINSLYSKHPNFEKFRKEIGKNNAKIHIRGLLGSSKNIFAAQVFAQIKQTTLIILDDKEEAAYFFNDLNNLLEPDSAYLLPSSYKRSVQYNFFDNTAIIDRTEILNRLNSQNPNIVIVTYPEALLEKVVTRKNLETNTLQLHKGEKISIDFIVEVLYEYQFERVDFVYEPGQFAVRGSIVDIFSYSNEYPYRIDFFGEEVETIRTFDTISQLSKAKLDVISIIPDLQTKTEEENRVSFLDFIPNQTIVWVKDLIYCTDRINEQYEKAKIKIEDHDNLKFEERVSFGEMFINGTDFQQLIVKHNLIEFGTKPATSTTQTFDFSTSLQPDFNKNFKLLINNLIEFQQQEYDIFIFSENEKQIERLNSIFDAECKKETIIFTSVLKALHSGFIDHDLKICCYTDHEIFKRYHRFKLRNSAVNAGREQLSFREISDLQPGDFVVHADHGIARFGGLQRTEVNGRMQETIRLIFKDNDNLFVSIHALHRISKFRGQEGEPPKINKLGSGAWQKLKNATKRKVKDIAKELISLYAARKDERGFSFSPDSYLQQELESSFIYEDTPDQLKTTNEVKADMEAIMPMDRLVCGDVGFGKTEIAIRAAFKAVADSKQVAVLVPTTILALQHYNTFSERLKDFPCTIDYLSRLKPVKSQKETIKKIAEGKIDIIIGTHRIVSNDIKFKDLGLLVVDEEQKFGVAIKEKLKKIRLNVDTLTLTATPIPRTMQFSLMGARDLSVIKTPPPNRYPIITELHTFNEEVIKQAIEYEIQRNGQVFFINNRVQNIYEIEKMINRICPDVLTVVAHGQMEGPKLEKIILDFINEEYGVLIATTIIESGLDIPNANTMIINNAQQFGLSDLHQLRGRVGRSNKKAFCYLLAPPLTSLPSDSRRRLKAITEFSELGSGFNIALHDLDIRGAGNILGAEQSGFIAEIGFETYQRILDEALIELRENEFKHVFADNEEDETQNTENKKFNKNLMGSKIVEMDYVADCLIDTDLELLFPESYINNISERIKLYRELDNLNSDEQLETFEKQLVDRFGEIPKQSKELLMIVKLRRVAKKIGIEKIILKENNFINYFVSNQDSPFYQSYTFTRIIEFVKKNPKKCLLRESSDKLVLTFNNVQGIKKAIDLLELICS